MRNTIAIYLPLVLISYMCTINGSFRTKDLLEYDSEVYTTLRIPNGEFSPIDVGELHQVRMHVENHDRKECWKQNCLGVLKYAVYYIECGKKPSRTEVERDISSNYYLICGG